MIGEVTRLRKCRGVESRLRVAPNAPAQEGERPNTSFGHSAHWTGCAVTREDRRLQGLLTPTFREIEMETRLCCGS
jgi:hypothetical protein